MTLSQSLSVIGVGGAARLTVRGFSKANAQLRAERCCAACDRSVPPISLTR
jgi:hypothetical protein